MDFASLDPMLRENDDKYVLRVVVETPRGCRHKFAWEPDLKAFTLKQTLSSGLSWPYDYGFIPQTLGDDGDPLDILVLMDDGTFSGCVFEARLLGGYIMTKNGVDNPRYIAALTPKKEVSLSTDGYDKIDDLPPALLNEIETFLTTYSAEKGNDVCCKGRVGRKEALAQICEKHEVWSSKQKKK